MDMFGDKAPDYDRDDLTIPEKIANIILFIFFLLQLVYFILEILIRGLYRKRNQEIKIKAIHSATIGIIFIQIISK